MNKISSWYNNLYKCQRVFIWLVLLFFFLIFVDNNQKEMILVSLFGIASLIYLEIGRRIFIKASKKQLLKIILGARVIAKNINDQISSDKIAKQFILEELDIARRHFSEIPEFAIQHGITSYEYIGASDNEDWGNEYEQDELLLHQLAFHKLTQPLISVGDKTGAAFLTGVMDEIMKLRNLGIYRFNDSNAHNNTYVLSSYKDTSPTINNTTVKNHKIDIATIIIVITFSLFAILCFLPAFL